MLGDNASEIERQVAEEIKNFLLARGSLHINVINLQEIESFKKGYNLVIIGTPKTNPLLGEVYAMTNATRVTEEFPGEGKGVLEILPNPWDESKAMLLVEGSDEWGVKESWILVNHCNRVNLHYLNTEKFKELLIDKISRFIKHYHVGMYKKYVSNWTILNSAIEIPYPKEQWKLKVAKNPENYTEIVKPPTVYILDEYNYTLPYWGYKCPNCYVVVLYTWTDYGGTLLKWEVTVKSGCLDYVKATVVDTFVGDFEPVPSEGRLLMSGMRIVGDPEVKEVCIDVS